MEFLYPFEINIKLECYNFRVLNAMPRVTTEKISVEYILKKMRMEFEHFIDPPPNQTQKKIETEDMSNKKL